MNKETFLEDLRGYLRILEDQEQEDILAEYAQHIDMKLQKGLSEEEAIRDFGPMRELAAEILEAYHVKPEFDEKSSSRRLDMKGIKIVDAGKSFRKMGGFLKGKFVACMHGIRRGFQWCAGKCRMTAAWMVRPFFRKKVLNGTGDEFMYGETGVLHNETYVNGEHEQIVSEQMEGGKERVLIEKGIEMRQKPKRSFLSAVFQGIKAAWNLFVAFCIWWLRLFWNLTWLFMAVLFGFFAMLTLMGLGAGVVLIPQGYPVVGILLICLGGMLCFGALSCGSFSLLIRKKKGVSNREAVISREEEKAEEEEATGEETELMEEQADPEEKAMDEKI